MQSYFSSDFHLGHKVIVKYRTQFSNQSEHDEFILDRIAELNKKSVLHILGDFIFDSPNYNYYINELKKMPCRIKLVMGNHDSLKLYKEDRFEVQLPLYSYKNIWVSHAPIHHQELRDRLGNIHGHLHYGVVNKRAYNMLDDDYESVPDERYFNVNLDNNDFRFVPLEDIKKHFSNI